MSDLATFLINELTTKLPPDRGFFIKGNHGWIRCPIHNNGQERTPSFTINLDLNSKAPLGFCGCFGCKAKMSWNEFAKLFNLTQISDGAVAEAVAGEIFKPPRNDVNYLPDMDRMLPWPASVPWRGINGDTVRTLGGRVMQHRGGFSLFFPVNVYGEPVGGVTALTERPADKSLLAYFNTPGEWSQNALFGYDIAAEKTGPLWIVEGPRDVANCVQNGVRVVGLLGSAVTREKLNLIADLDPPAVLIATDPDAAGKGAAKALHRALSTVLPTVRLRMKPGTDPADLKPKQFDKINKFMSKYR
jgi:hypothetical protein